MVVEVVAPAADDYDDLEDQDAAGWSESATARNTNCTCMMAMFTEIM